MSTRDAHDDELFPDELADDAAAAAQAYAQNGNGHDASAELVAPTPFELDPEITILELQCAPTAPPAIVENYLFEDVEAFIAPGGIGKTTLRLKEYVNIALGLPLWGQRVVRAGACVFVTAEDRREICVGRLREICNSMELTSSSRHRYLRRSAATPQSLRVRADSTKLWNIGLGPCRITRNQRGRDSVGSSAETTGAA